MFTRFYLSLHLSYVYPWLLVFTYGNSCLPMFTTVFSCSFTYVYPCLLVIAYV